MGLKAQEVPLPSYFNLTQPFWYFVSRRERGLFFCKVYYSHDSFHFPKRVRKFNGQVCVCVCVSDNLIRGQS